MEVWDFILSKLSKSVNIQLMYVLESEGSSSGRKGFKMAVSADGDFCGTIGGGIMEHKLVEKAKVMLRKNEKTVLLKRQHHDKEHTVDQSGMICSGSQLNAFIPLTAADQQIIKKIISKENKTIHLSSKGIQLTDELAYGLQYKTETDWFYTEDIKEQPVIHIIGGGHVGLALSELMHYLGFYIKIYDDRPDLNTLYQNHFAHEKIIIPAYEKLADFIEAGVNDYVAIMTVGYRTDKVVLKQLINKPFFYLGLMGSDHKIETLFKELKEEGYSPESLEKIFTPIGIHIFSKTTREIAVSIAAEIIREKNKNLPTGRNY